MFKLCDFCKKEFWSKGVRHRFCSTECSRKYSFQEREKTPFYKNRFLIFARDSFTCIYCGRVSYKDKVELHVEHIYPVKKGGTDKLFNLATACGECNREKSVSLLSDETILKLWEVIEERNRTRLKAKTCSELEKYFTEHNNLYRRSR